ncbi:MAG: tetratricopeptide repeat protein [Planctomycetes bacterium]|nr:tetratricopeptide repeat protein [Planctomycetota bacterium]
MTLLAGAPEPVSDADRIRVLRTELQQKIAYLEEFHARTQALALALKDLGDLETKQGNASKALAYLNRALEIAEGLFGMDDPEVAGYLGYLGTANAAVGKTQLAYEQFHRSQLIDQAHFGPDAISTGTMHQLAGKAAWSLRDLSVAVENYRLGMVAYKKHLSPGDSNALSIQNNLAMVLHDMGRYQDSKQEYEEILALVMGHHGPSPIGFSSFIVNYGVLLKEMGELQDAAALFETGYNLRVEGYGADDLYTIYAENFLAVSLGDVGRLEQALPFSQHVYESRKEQLGPQHRETREALNNLASNGQDLGKRIQAKSLYEEALGDWPEDESDFGDKVTVLNNLGSIYLELGDLKSARRMFQQSILLLERYDSDSPSALKKAVFTL